jgi:hypothetical protein
MMMECVLFDDTMKAFIVSGQLTSIYTAIPPKVFSLESIIYKQVISAVKSAVASGRTKHNDCIIGLAARQHSLFA